MKGFLDFAIELMLDENNDASILNYAIKIISNKNLGVNAKDYYSKQIHHLVLLYPYLVNFIEYDVFESHNISKEVIKKISIDIYNYGLEKKSYEASTYAIYWAMKYDFKLDIGTLKFDSIESNDCIFMMIAYLYDKKYERKLYLKEYKDRAKVLKSEDFDRYWIFIYELLPWNELTDNYRVMKRNNLTFIKAEFN